MAFPPLLLTPPCPHKVAPLWAAENGPPAVKATGAMGDASRSCGIGHPCGPYPALSQPAVCSPLGAGDCPAPLGASGDGVREDPQVFQATDRVGREPDGYIHGGKDHMTADSVAMFDGLTLTAEEARRAIRAYAAAEDVWEWRTGPEDEPARGPRSGGDGRALTVYRAGVTATCADGETLPLLGKGAT